MGAVVGENLRRLRSQRGQTRAEAAQLLQEHGLKWQRDHLTNVELGRRPVIELDALLLVASAYNVQPAELFAGDGDVALSDTVSVGREQIRGVFNGELLGPVHVHGDLVKMLTDRARGLEDADHAVAGRLGVPSRRVLAAARELWGHTLTVERDQRLGDLSDSPPRTVQAKRGAMVRALTAEIAAHLERPGSE